MSNSLIDVVLAPKDMKKSSAKTAQLSQIETPAPRQRVVLLGASNLSIMFPTIVETARAMYAQPLEMFVAKGFGRSYGQQSKFFGKKFPGILQSGLWDAMSRAQALPTVAIIADIGNDLAYEAPVDTIIKWIETALDRLASYGARVVLNEPPLDSLKRVGTVRYRVMRELLFPKCRLSRAELLSRAERLSERLHELSREREIPIFAGESAAYGLDPIHPRRASAGDVWERMLSALSPTSSGRPLVHPAPIDSLRFYQLKPHTWSVYGWSRCAEQPCRRLADGTTIAIY
jgi:hypothetical protein